MGIELMRLIDCWLGVPLCFLFSAVDRLLRLIGFSGKSRKNTVDKIAFIKLSEMGAIILSYPLLAAAKKGHPQADLFFITFRKNKAIFSLLAGSIKERNILTIRDTGVSVFIIDTLKAVLRLRRQKVNIIFDLEFFSRFTAILAYLSGAAKRIGFYNYNYEGLYRGSLFTHQLQYNPLLHVSRSYLSLWQAIKEEKKTSPELGEKIEDKDIVLPRVDPDKAEIVKAKEFLKQHGVKEAAKVFLLNPGEGILPLREWPIENFINLARKILEEENNYLVLIGTKEAMKKAALLAGIVGNSRCVNLTGKTDIAGLPALFGISQALIANDCGLAHIAALSGIKKFIIFGPETPAVFAPLGVNNFIFYSGLACSPCLSALNHRKSSCRDNQCLKAIKWQAVYGLINDTCRN